ncbi:hypothetical protein D3C73_1247430 [compost metagenome]
MLEIHIIIEAILNHRTNAQLDFLRTEQASGRLSHQVGCTVTHHFQAFRRIQGDNFDQCAFLQLSRQINNNSVELACGGILAQPAADRSSYIIDRAAVLIFPDRSVRQFNTY